MDILVAVGDLHCNSRHGLMPPVVRLNEGQKVQASDYQLWIWDKWEYFWRLVERIKRKTKGNVVCLINGEACDINWRGQVELVSLDEEDAKNIAFESLEVTDGIVDKFVVSYGTEAHVGPNGKLDRQVAQRYGAISGHVNRFSVGDLRVHAQHHPRFHSSLPWGKGGPMVRWATMLQLKYGRDTWPHLALGSHFHDFDSSGEITPIRAETLPSWKLSDSYVSRLGESFPADIGGIIYWYDGKVKSHKESYKWPIAESTEKFPKVLS